MTSGEPRSSETFQSLEGFASRLSGMKLIGLWGLCVVGVYASMLLSQLAPVLFGLALWFCVVFPFVITFFWVRNRRKPPR